MAEERLPAAYLQFFMNGWLLRDLAGYRSLRKLVDDQNLEGLAGIYSQYRVDILDYWLATMEPGDPEPYFETIYQQLEAI